MKILTLLITVLALLSLIACYDSTSVSTPHPGSRVSNDNVFSSQVKALEKAEHLEKEMMDAFQQRNAAIDASIDP